MISQAAWISGRQKITATPPFGTFDDYSQSTFLGEFADDAAADAGTSFVEIGQWYYETTHHKARWWAFIAHTGLYWEDVPILTLFGTGHEHVWLGYNINLSTRLFSKFTTSDDQ